MVGRLPKTYGASTEQPQSAYTHGPMTDDPLVYENAQGSAYYMADGLQSKGLLTDSTGSVKAWRRYDPWGRIIGQQGTMPTYGFTGREPDLTTGLTYYRSRYYDPTIGRFISRDPAGLEGGINAYAYVNNDPVDNTDPDGMYARSITNTVSSTYTSACHRPA